LTLNFSNEGRAFGCLHQLIKSHLHPLFQVSNTEALQHQVRLRPSHAQSSQATLPVQMRRYRRLLAFHEPELAVHLHDVGFDPELYAVPWFLTLFARTSHSVIFAYAADILPMERIYHLWDTLLLAPNTFPMFVAVAVCCNGCEYGDVI